MKKQDLVKVGKKWIDRNTFEPRAKRCSHCSYLKDEGDNHTVSCKVFPWIISRQLSKKQAVCSSKTKATEILVTGSDENKEETIWSELK